MILRGRELVQAECDEWGEDRVRAHVNTYPDDPERVHRLEWLYIRARAANKEVPNREWAAVAPEIQRPIKVGWGYGMPPLASGLYGRWWQLETWLRSLVYVELRAARGAAWMDALPKTSESRQQGENGFRYMATADAQDRLAYTDASVLFKIMQDHWNLFENSLLPKNVWAGRIEELLAIRNRIGHCRRPHADDLVRLEQTLRDLDGGAFIATSAFNRQWRADENWTDAVVDGWVSTHHNDAVRLVEHADRQYETTFELRYSRRPRCESSSGKQTISGVPGHVWHAFWYFRGGRSFDLRSFWRDVARYRDTILMVCADSPSSIDVSFSAMDDPKTIADAIGLCFDAALYCIGRGSASDDYTQWRERYAELDPRVQVVTPWSTIDESMHGVSVFSA